MTERVALNLRLPKSLHRGLVALAEREYRSLNDQIVAILARTVIDHLAPHRDDLPTIAQRFVVATEPYLVLPKPSGGRLNFSVGPLPYPALLTFSSHAKMCATVAQIRSVLGSTS